MAGKTTGKATTGKSMIHIGNEKESVLAVGEIILKILETSSDESTKAEALKVMTHSLQINGLTTIKDCTFAN